jgi:hypothetical protein
VVPVGDAVALASAIDAVADQVRSGISVDQSGALAYARGFEPRQATSALRERIDAFERHST